jgi:hypothetical protein
MQSLGVEEHDVVGDDALGESAVSIDLVVDLDTRNSDERHGADVCPEDLKIQPAISAKIWTPGI